MQLGLAVQYGQYGGSARNNKHGTSVYIGQVNAGPEQMNEQMRGLKHEPMDAWMAEWTEDREMERWRGGE